MRSDRDASDRIRLPIWNNRRRWFVAIACCAIVAALESIRPATLDAAVEIPPGVADYAEALDDLLKSKGKQPIEPVFEAGMQASPSIQAVLPDLSEAQFQQVQRQMPGFVVVRAETIFVHPSVDYFRALARKIGSKADRAFFDIYARTEPDANGGFPAYIRQQTDEAGCTLFDGKLVTELYRGWLSFRTEYPDAYAPEAQGEIDSIETELRSGICSCDDAKKTAAGLQTFVDAFPDAPITPKIKTRIAQIRSGKSGFRFNCHAG